MPQLQGLKKAVKGAAALGAAGTAGYYALSGDEKPTDPTLGQAPLAPTQAPAAVPTAEDSTSKSTTVQTTQRGYTPKPIEAPQLSALEELQIVEPRDLEERQKELEAARRTPAQKAVFGSQLKLLDQEIKDINTRYSALRTEAKTKAEADAARAGWARVAETLANAAITIAAAQQGLAKNQNIVGQLQLSRTDWQKEIDSILRRGQEERALYMQEEKALTSEIGERSRRVEREEERDYRAEEAALNDVRQAQAGEARDIRQENLQRDRVNLKEKADREEAQARLDFQAAQQNEEGRRAAAPTVTSSTTEREASKEGVSAASAKAQASEKAAKLKAFGDLTGAIEAIKQSGGDTPANRKQAADAATLIGMPPSEFETLVKETTGAGIFNLAEPKKAQDILNKYDPRAVQGASQPAVANLVNVRQKSTGRVVPVDAARAAKILQSPDYEKAE
jgi:hypothetical protein